MIKQCSNRSFQKFVKHVIIEGSSSKKKLYDDSLPAMTILKEEPEKFPKNFSE